jgi:hypothetical protein
LASSSIQSEPSGAFFDIADAFADVPALDRGGAALAVERDANNGLGAQGADQALPFQCGKTWPL